ncbi:MAG: uncharacterized protein QOK37_2903 [Thermoanaerobaculia bacterium]|jgi:uncharacterized DUF497 family protein|nr:uncharacterized protein [Thermoanaerobaculia bacterium]
MKPVGFDWDDDKAAANLAKHDVSFEEATSVFDDPLARIHDDPDHSTGETREIITGYTRTGRLLLVCFTERGDEIRIINARKPDKDERYHYEEESSR